MVKHICPTCFKEFKKKTHYINHTEHKKKPCKPKEPNLDNNSSNLDIFSQNLPNIQNITEKIIILDKLKNTESLIEPKINQNLTNEELCQNNCNFCYKSFKDKYSLQRHLKDRCKVKKIDNEKKEQILNNLIEKEKINILLNNFEIQQKSILNLQESNKNLQENNKNLEKQIKELEKKLKESNKNYDEQIKNVITKNINSNNTNNTNNIVNNTNIVNNNIVIPSSKLVNFGKEDLSKIEYSEIMKKIYSPFTNGTTLFNELLLLIHFNPNHPEFQNIYMSDNNREHYMSFEDNEWKLSESAYNTIVQQIHDLKELNEDNFIEVFEDKNHKYYKPTEKLYSNLNKYFEEDDNGKRNIEFMKIVDKKLKATLYNNKDKIKENFKKLKDDVIKDKNDKLIK